MRIHTRVEFEWDGKRYVPIHEEGFEYEGPLDLCGGGQANAGQASQAATNANNSVQQNLGLGAQYGANAQNLYNLFFGSPTGKGGTLSGFTNPASLNVTTPTGAYKTNYEQQIGQIAKSGNQGVQSIIQNAANNGLGLSSPAAANLALQSRLNTANLSGEAFNQAVTTQQQQALQNFWNATNIGAGIAGADTSASVGATTGAGSTSSEIYGTAGQYHPPTWAGPVGAAIGAGGAVGAAGVCPSAGSKIKTPHGEKVVEEMNAGDEIAQLGGGRSRLKCKPIPFEDVRLFGIRFSNKRGCVVGERHAFCAADGGYYNAEDLKPGQLVKAENESRFLSVVEIKDLDKGVVYKIVTDDDDTNRTYCVDGLWSLE